MLLWFLLWRFCDLVFQGPLSVQEDWIKHLQRHIMNTGVPHTGLGMVDVPPLITEPPILKTDEDSSLAVTNVASWGQRGSLGTGSPTGTFFRSLECMCMYMWRSFTFFFIISTVLARVHVHVGASGRFHSSFGSCHHWILSTVSWLSAVVLNPFQMKQPLPQTAHGWSLFLWFPLSSSRDALQKRGAHRGAFPRRCKKK